MYTEENDYKYVVKDNDEELRPPGTWTCRTEEARGRIDLNELPEEEVTWMKKYGIMADRKSGLIILEVGEPLEHYLLRVNIAYHDKRDTRGGEEMFWKKMALHYARYQQLRSDPSPKELVERTSLYLARVLDPGSSCMITKMAWPAAMLAILYYIVREFKMERAIMRSLIQHQAAVIQGYVKTLGFDTTNEAIRLNRMESWMLADPEQDRDLTGEPLPDDEKAEMIISLMGLNFIHSKLFNTRLQDFYREKGIVTSPYWTPKSQHTIP
jgi:hypothetical protein